MKKLTAFAVVGAVASLSLAPAAFAQSDRTTQPPSRSTDRPAEKNREAFKAPDGVVESAKLIGTRVKDSTGKDLGEIEQILVDSKAGKVTHAVVGKGGVLGVGETKVVVPWSSVALKTDPDNRDRLVANMDQATLDAAPRWDRRAAADRPAPSASPRADDKRPPAQR